MQSVSRTTSTQENGNIIALNLTLATAPVVSSHCPHSLLAHTYLRPIFVPNAPRLASASPYVSSSFLQSAFLLDLFFFFSHQTMPASLILARKRARLNLAFFFTSSFYEFSYFVFFSTAIQSNHVSHCPHTPAYPIKIRLGPLQIVRKKPRNASQFMPLR